jgi:hypothetical protein
MNKKIMNIKFLVAVILVFFNSAFAQQPYRVGTTTASFLEIGYGPAGVSMGDAMVSSTDDIEAIYWNPAGLAYMNNHEALFYSKPWVVDISLGMAAVGVVIPPVGTLALGVWYADFGQMEVTTMEMQDGTGEQFNASDYSFSLSYARMLADWFSFGASVKYIFSSIWKARASAVAADMGVILNTGFFSFTGQFEDGMKLGMSISNFGTKMQYDGMILLEPIDPLPNENGNYSKVEGQYRLREWELPLIFRIGVSVTPIKTEQSRMILNVDALHPNNNSESINVGASYLYRVFTFGDLFVRGGYKGLFMDNTQYGLCAGGGFNMHLFGNLQVKVEYSYQDLKELGYVNSFGVAIKF